ncbi:MAG: hypothetical protein U0929_02995 [Planctomycetaceae bacterium]
MDGCITIFRVRPSWLSLLLMLVCGTAWAVEPRAKTAAGSRDAVRIASLSFVEPTGQQREVMEVWSNGTVKAFELTGTPQNPVVVTHTDRLSPTELRSLHQLLVDECRLATQTSAGLSEAINVASVEQQLTANIEGAASSEIGVLVGREWRTVTCPAVSILATRFPQVTEVQNFAAAQSRLQNVAAVALLGGAKAADQQAATATHKLKEMHPEAGVITRRDLLMVRRLPNDSRIVQFRYAGPPGADEGYLVNMTQTPEGPTRVSVMDSPTVVR